MRGTKLIWIVLTIMSGHHGEGRGQRTQNVTEGQSVSLTCGEPDRHSWFIGSKQISADRRRQMDKHGNLHFAYVDVSDTEEYRCGIVINSVVKLVHPVTLNVMEGNVTKTSPKLIYSTEATNVSLGHDVTQQCIFSGRPVPVVTWYRDDKQVTNTTRVKLSYTTVTIKNVSEEDEGIYRCTGKNGVAYDSHDVTLIVIAPQNDNQSTTPVQQNDDTTAASVPVIVLAVVFIVLVLTGTVVCTMIWRLKKTNTENRKTSFQHNGMGQ